MIARLTHFLSIRIWEVRTKDLPPARRFLFACLRVTVLALYRFYQDTCSLRASALTYYSLLSLVPVIAMFFGIAKGFGFDRLLEKQVLDIGTRANWPPEVVGQILAFAGALLEQAKGGVIAGVGVAVLFWTVISILGHVEQAFNAIWEVRKPRTLVRKFTDYVSIIVVTPILLLISSSITVVAASGIEAVARKLAVLGPLGPALVLALKGLPYVFMWILLMFNYIIIPNTRVRVASGMLAAVVAGTVFQVVQWVYITFQIGVAKYGAIYGSFAALPLFLAWLYISWVIVLFGAEIAVAHENGETYGFHPDLSRLSVATRKVLMLRVLRLVVKRFVDEQGPMSAHQIAAALEIPLRFARRSLAELSSADLVVETTVEADHEPAFELAAAVERLTIMHALESIEHAGWNQSRLSGNEDAARILAHVDAIARAAEGMPENVPLKDV